jgi:hexosaminidase
MPVPAKLQAGNGQWVVQQGFTIYLGGDPSCTGSRRRSSVMGLTVSISEGGDPRLGAATLRFVDHLSRATGIPLRYQPGDEDKATIAIRCEHSGDKVQKLGEDESYVLDVTESGAKLSAPTTLGVIHGLQTLLQLVGPTQQGFAAPAVHIEDAPRFPWRGLLLDACRHWMPVGVVKRTLDGMEAVKMNVLHFHLSEYQGFRVESKKFPKLQEMGSNGFYYTQDEIKDVISYARDRGIRVVPEFDMPGHSTSWFVGYPELAAAPGPYQIEKRWGVFDPAMDPTKESTYKFLDKFIGEMAELFPDDFFHLGGDEVNGKQWDANPEIQKFKKLHNLKTNGDLQAYFNQHVVKIIEKYKKTPVGWDEVLHPDLPKDVVVQSWRGPESEAKAVQAGHRALLSHGYYLDLAESAESHYLVDPLSGDAANLSPEQQKMILGGEACMWSEMVTPENVDSRLWPRNAAIAERLWSPADVRDVNSMYQRLEVMSDRLDTLGLTHHSALRMMQERLAPDNLQSVRTLADTVEPAKGYHRGSREKYNTDAALNGFPDSIPPESIPARNFAQLVERVLSGSSSPEDLTAAHDLMDAWSLNHQKLAPALQNLPLSEDSQVSQDLSTASSIGLQALDMFAAHTPAPAGWADQQIAQLEEMKKREAEVLLMIVPPIEKLVQAVGK